MPNGVPHPRIGCKEVIEAMVAHPHFNAPLEGANRGRGIAIGHRFNSGQTSSATINVNSNGTISLLTGSVDIGGTRTAVAMQAAEVLGLGADDVTPVVVDTDSVGYTGSTGGSRTAYDTGLAAIAAAEEVKRQMMARAALIWEVQPEDVEFQDGVFTLHQEPGRQNDLQRAGPTTYPHRRGYNLLRVSGLNRRGVHLLREYRGRGGGP